MTETFDPCASALENLNDAIDATRRFPTNVFVGDWTSYFFFDSDLMFDAEFVKIVKQLFEVEAAACVCLSNLDVKSDAGQAEFLYLDLQLTPDAYRSMLSGPGPEKGWIYGMDRFACVSEIAEWCIYCEKGNEIAVIAVRKDVPVERYLSVIVQLKAMQIEKALALPLSFGFSGLSAQWRGELLREYATRRP